MLHHLLELGKSAGGNITRIDNGLGKIPGYLGEYQAKLEDLRHRQEAAMAEMDKPFPLEAELAGKSARLAELDAELNIGRSQAA